MTSNKKLCWLGTAVVYGLTGCWPALALTGLDDIGQLPSIQNPPLATPSAAVHTASTAGIAPQQTQYVVVQQLTTLAEKLESDINTLKQNKASQQEVDALRTMQSQVLSSLQAVTRQLNQLEAVDNEQNTRLALLEKVQLHGDMTLGALADMNSSGVGSARGIQDAISTLGRLRLTVDVPVVTPKTDTDKLGPGTVSTRLIAAFGRFGPIGNDGTDTAGANYPFNLYSRIAADVSAFNEGFGTGAVGSSGNTGVLNGQNGNTSMTRPNVYLESAFYRQTFRHGIPLLTSLPGFSSQEESRPEWQNSADLYAGLVRWWDIFDVSPYRGDEMSQFQNNAFINIPGIAVNVAQPMVAYQLHKGLGKSATADLAVGLGSLDVGDLMNTLNLTYEAKLNYVPRFLPERYQKPGSVYAGLYHVFMAGNRNFNTAIQAGLNYPTRDGQPFNPDFEQQDAKAFYAGWNQEWWRGIGTNVGFLLNQKSPSVVLLTTQQPGPANVTAGAHAAFTSALSVPLSVFGSQARPNDSLGLGYAFVDVQDGGSVLRDLSGEGLEHVVEAYYKLSLTKNFSIIPSVQLIFNALGLNQNGVHTVLGVRANYKF